MYQFHLPSESSFHFVARSILWQNTNCASAMEQALIESDACVADLGKLTPNGALPFSCSSYPVPFVPVEIDHGRAREGSAAEELLRHIRPDWPSERIRYDVFTAGYTNLLISCQLSGGSSSDALLVRVYGRGTDVMIDRQQERNSMVVLNTLDLSAPVYCRFKNGIAYGFQPGVALDCDQVCEPELQKLIIEELAKLHSIDLDAACAKFGNGLRFNTTPSLFQTLYSWLEHVPDSFDDDIEKQQKFEGLGISKKQLAEEVECLEKHLCCLGSPVVFCHNDLLPKNIIYNEEKQRVHFIDFEYIAYNYQAFDIANHFCEYAGMVEVDFSRYPSREYQLNWLRLFLQTTYRCKSLDPADVTDTDVERLYVQVNKFALAAHLFWSVWGVIQARHSTIDYDYLDFARVRLDQYRAHKADALALTMPHS